MQRENPPSSVISPLKGLAVQSFNGFFYVRINEASEQLWCARFSSPCGLQTFWCPCAHYSDAIMSAMASQIAEVTIVYSSVCSSAYQRKINPPRHWPLRWEFTGGRWISNTKASKTENVSIWWRHNDLILTGVPWTMLHSTYTEIQPKNELLRSRGCWLSVCYQKRVCNPWVNISFTKPIRK